MLKSICGLLGIILTVMQIGFVAPCQAEQIEYFDITALLKKIPIAVPVFKPLGTAATEAKVALQSANLLSVALDFTGYFKLLDRRSFLIKPDQFGIVRSQIVFPNWTGIGAELLVTAGVLQKGKIVELEMRLFEAKP